MFTTREPGWALDDRNESMAGGGEDMWVRRSAPRPLFEPMHFILSVWRARYWILLAGVGGAAVAAAIAVSTPKQYTASTQLILDPRALNLVQNEVTPNGISAEATLALIQSQIAVITSNSVLSRVVDQANLAQDPEFNGMRPSFIERTLPSGVLLLIGEADEEPVDARLMTLSNLRKKVSAGRSANSFVIDVAVTSEDAHKATDLANLTAEIFVGEQARAQSDVAGRASADLSARLSDLRQRVGDAESAVERYKADNQLVGVGGRLIDDEYILRINNQLADVRATITALGVRAQSMRDASVDDVVDGTIPEELTSESLVRLRQTFAALQQEQAVVAAQLGPRHPQRISGEQALASARRAIAGELTRIVASAQTELARAQETERELTQQIEGLRGQQIETSGAFVALRELERDVDASRAVYENYLLRARELAQQESLNTVNVRTISEATVPFSPSGASRKIVVLLGLLAGLAAGLALASFIAVLRGLRLAFADRPAFALAGPDGAYHGSYVALPAPRRPLRPAAHTNGPPAPAAPPSVAAVAPDAGAPVVEPTPPEERPAEDVDAKPTVAISPLRPSGTAAETAPSPELATEQPAASEPAVLEPEQTETTAEDAVTPPASEAAGADITDRRDRLRARIREIAARRAPANAALDSEAQHYVERSGGRPRRQTIADMQRRRLVDRVKPKD